MPEVKITDRHQFHEIAATLHRAELKFVGRVQIIISIGFAVLFLNKLFFHDSILLLTVGLVIIMIVTTVVSLRYDQKIKHPDQAAFFVTIRQSSFDYPGIGRMLIYLLPAVLVATGYYSHIELWFYVVFYAGCYVATRAYAWYWMHWVKASELEIFGNSDASNVKT